MNKLIFNNNWPDLWKEAYSYDRLEIYGQKHLNPGYFYAYQNRSFEAIKFLKDNCNISGSVLDIAAAQGNFSLRLAEIGFDVTWNDLRGDLADYVRLKWEKGKVDFNTGNIFEIDFDRLFDAVLATEIIEHVAHPDEFLNKISKLIKPGGHIVLTTPLGNYFKNKLPKFSDCINPDIFESKQFGPGGNDHIFLLHYDEIESLASKAGLICLKKKYYNNPLTSGHIKLSFLLKILPAFIVRFTEKITRRFPNILGLKLHSGMAILLQKPLDSI